MFVAEYRNGAPAIAKHFDNLLEELVARIFGLPFFVLRVMAVLADEHHAINGKFAAAQRQRLGDGRIDFHFRMASGSFAAQVIFAHLVNVQGNRIQRRAVMRAVPAVAVEKTVHNVLRVRHAEIDGADRDQPQGRL